LDSFRTFKGNITIENIRLNQLTNIPVSVIDTIYMLIIPYLSISPTLILTIILYEESN